MCVTADEQRPGGALGGAIFDDGLGDGQDVRLVERSVERRAAVTRSAERHLLSDVVRIGLDRVVRSDQVGQIDEVFGLGRLTGTRVGHGYQFCPCPTRRAARTSSVLPGFTRS